MQIRAQIRQETAGDGPTIKDLITAAFHRSDEAMLVARRRNDGDAVLSLVAEDKGQITGHILLSRMKAPFKALGLAPVSVHPSAQNQGIGSALIHQAIEICKGDGWDAIFVLGELQYYSRFGFEVGLAASFQSPYAGPYFMVLPLSPAFKVTNTAVDYAPAFQSL